MTGLPQGQTDEAEAVAEERVGDDLPVDVTLIDEMLRLSPEERLLQNDRMINTIRDLRNAFRKS